jgi:putrescine:ornithine antiporter
VTVWGVIIPVAGICMIGWFFFSGATFKQAWNPQGLSIGAGMSSSIALTLWAFLGMESAAQNSDAVENPKRNVPLACMFGTLGAAVIYILSTTVIQGIVPNKLLAESTGPFADAYAQMFGGRWARSSARSRSSRAWVAAGLAVHDRPDRKTAAGEGLFPSCSRRPIACSRRWRAWS